MAGHPLDPFAAHDKRSAFRNPCRAKCLDPVELASVDQRSHVVSVNAGSDRPQRCQFDNPLDEFVMHASMHNQP